MDPAAAAEAAAKLAILKLNLGALLSGAAVVTFLFGVVTVQVYMYASVDFNDRAVLRYLVGMIWITDIILVIFTWIFVFKPLILDYGSPNIDDLHWTLRAVVVCSSLIQCPTQAFYAYRVRILSGKRLLPYLVWFGIVVRFWFFNSAVIVSRKTDSLTTFFDNYFWLFTVSISEGLFLDFVNTGALSYYLFSRGMKFPRTKRIVMGFMLRTIEVGIPTCMCGLSLVTLISIRKPNLVGVLLMLVGIYPQFYALSLMISLNARRVLREPSTLVSTTDYQSNVWGTTNSEQKHRSQRTGSKATPAEISVTRTVEIELSQVPPTQKRSEDTPLAEEEGFREGKSAYSYAV